MLLDLIFGAILLDIRPTKVGTATINDPNIANEKAKIITTAMPIKN